MVSPYDQFRGTEKDTAGVLDGARVVEALEYGHNRTVRRCIDGISKHGIYHALSIQERLDKIKRHVKRYEDGDRSEDHLAAIAASAEFAMTEELRLADIEDDRP